MFLHLSVILFTSRGGVCPSACWDTHPQQIPLPPGQTSLLGRHPPKTPHSGIHPTRADTPPRQTAPLPSSCWDTQPPAQCILGYTPLLPNACWDTHGQCCGRYASYCNVFLFETETTFNTTKTTSHH